MSELWNRVFPRNYSSKVTLTGGKISVKGDKMSRSTLHEIKETLLECDCQKGSVTLKKDGKLSFSREIPPACHQRLRNLIRLRS